MAPFTRVTRARANTRSRRSTSRPTRPQGRAGRSEADQSHDQAKRISARSRIFVMRRVIDHRRRHLDQLGHRENRQQRHEQRSACDGAAPAEHESAAPPPAETWPVAPGAAPDEQAHREAAKTHVSRPPAADLARQQPRCATVRATHRSPRTRCRSSRHPSPPSPPTSAANRPHPAPEFLLQKRTTP
jgi:hypothetical protein